jgi:hypothetical protein
MDTHEERKMLNALLNFSLFCVLAFWTFALASLALGWDWGTTAGACGLWLLIIVLYDINKALDKRGEKPSS